MSSPSSSSNPPSRSTKTPLSSNKRKTVPLCNGEGDSGAGSAAYDICHFSQDDIEQQPPKKTGKLVKKTQRVFVGILHKPLQQTEGISYSSAGEAVNQTNGTETGDEQGSQSSSAETIDLTQEASQPAQPLSFIDHAIQFNKEKQHLEQQNESLRVKVAILETTVRELTKKTRELEDLKVALELQDRELVEERDRIQADYDRLDKAFKKLQESVLKQVRELEKVCEVKKDRRAVDDNGEQREKTGSEVDIDDEVAWTN